MRYKVEIEGRTFTVEITERSDRLELTVDGKPVDADWEWLGSDRHMSLLIDGRSYNLNIEPQNGQLHMYQPGERFICTVQDERLAELRRLAGDTNVTDGKIEIKAPMPGLILKVFTQPGAEVTRGDRLLIIEAMKMENELKSPRDGIVKAIHCAEQQAVEQGKVLLVLE
jgi:biotin carboxyl carrier protein